ncbi:uncharacterized protein K452DRAFT_317494 [Aplosporella prunicola CBS 121167]|uniref:Uncharacterized protein n=1 Tax=Aplosporella prunicola CBS 121167 TaxID=1176127 RepID=A0A6A6BGQ0_9PEZI|nr:uncharacterized protein K452DRAFT_317494 [Aplosporella prunicola CBS 121167]KAF2143332.1 hypothetical protein K452DRAFT_317494 [Aplosporella prunicola CBS 121167]
MDKFASIAKGGWHPEKNSSSSSSSGEKQGLRDRAKGFMGKGNDSYESASNHQSRPLSSLRDPASFGPPPKHQGYHGGGQARSPGSPATAGGFSQRQIQASEEHEEEANRPPPGPYSVNTTGLSTAHLPKPPARRPGQGLPAATSPAPASPGPPRLPPRLPPRQNSHPDAYAPPPPPTYQESVHSPPANDAMLNQGALGRLGQAGVSVPGFNIGRTASPPVPPRNTSQTPPLPPRTGQTPPTQSPATTGHGGQLSQLQSRFSRMSTPSQGAETPQQGTTFAQKQSAFKTANALRTNPSSVSFSDMRSAASTANNFRERHGEQVATGVHTANGLNQKYGVMNRVNGLAAGSGTAGPSIASPVGKKPPPPPPKRKDLTGDTGGPPPVPFSSKPRQ